MTTRVCLVLSLLLAGALGGCLADHKPGDDAVDTGREPFDRPHDLLGCTEMLVVISVDKARAQDRLPENVTALEAGDFLGVPLPEGSAAMVVATFRCGGVEGYTGALEWASLSLVIETPTIANETFGAAIDLYPLDYYADRAEERALLERIGIRAENGSVQQAPLVPDRFVGGDVSVLGDDGKVRYRFGVATPRSATGEGTVRQWAVDAEGIGWLDSSWTTTDQIGTATHCTLGAATVAASILRDTDCSEEAILGAYRSIDFEGALHWRPAGSPTS